MSGAVIVCFVSLFCLCVIKDQSDDLELGKKKCVKKVYLVPYYFTQTIVHSGSVF